MTKPLTKLAIRRRLMAYDRQILALPKVELSTVKLGTIIMTEDHRFWTVGKRRKLLPLPRDPQKPINGFLTAVDNDSLIRVISQDIIDNVRNLYRQLEAFDEST